MSIEKSVVIGTFGSLYSIEQAVESLKSLQDVAYKVVGNHTLIVRIRNPRDESLRKKIQEIITSSKGYVEAEMPKTAKSKGGKISPLDYPVFG
ncbi:MAG: hypothetical protein HYU39_02980 [Thaumarchaeota archaeon]|nr:hypothetical protein [Nitrososphaerota archaeon]